MKLIDGPFSFGGKSLTQDLPLYDDESGDSWKPVEIPDDLQHLLANLLIEKPNKTKATSSLFKTGFVRHSILVRKTMSPLDMIASYSSNSW